MGGRAIAAAVVCVGTPAGLKRRSVRDIRPCRFAADPTGSLPWKYRFVPKNKPMPAWRSTPVWSQVELHTIAPAKAEEAASGRMPIFVMPPYLCCEFPIL